MPHKNVIAKKSYYTVPEIAEELGTSRQNLYQNYIETGLLETVKVSNYHLVSAAEYRKFKGVYRQHSYKAKGLRE